MNQPNHILNELQALSPTLASIPKVNVYSVPEGYFDSLSTIILLQTSDNKQVISGSVPEGYFEGLADSIMNRIKSESFSVEESSQVLSGIGNKNVFSVPEGYFEQLPAKMLSLVKDASVMEETSFVSPLVAGIGNKNVFTVPEGYFENFNVNAEQQETGAKVIKMKPRTNVFRYAAAAVVTGILAVSSYFLVNSKGSTKLDEQTAQVVKEGNSIAKTNSFEKEMSTVSDADIVAYLESNGEDVNAALVASLTDDASKLPEATDYMIDEKTLDNMLNDLDLN